jgi:hypothetical protein
MHEVVVAQVTDERKPPIPNAAPSVSCLAFAALQLAGLPWNSSGSFLLEAPTATHAVADVQWMDERCPP